MSDDLSLATRKLLDLEGGFEGIEKPNLEGKKLRRKEREELATIFHGTFTSEYGIQAIEKLVEMFLTKPIANPKDDLISIGIREGQARIVRFMLQQIEIIDKGE